MSRRIGSVSRRGTGAALCCTACHTRPDDCVPACGQSNQTALFNWDGKDSNGRVLQGRQPVRVRVAYQYECVYGAGGGGFGSPPGPVSVEASAECKVFLYRDWTGWVGGWDDQRRGLGGWALSAQHAYDPETKVLFMGDGTERTAEGLPPILTGFAGTGTYCSTSSCLGDGGPATSARFAYPQALASGPDGSVYILDTTQRRIRKVGPDGIIHTVAGNGSYQPLNEGGLATQAGLGDPRGIALGEDGSLYFSDAYNRRVRRVSPDGIISTVAGNGSTGSAGNGGLATLAAVGSPGAVAVSKDGSLFVVDGLRIRRVDPGGIINAYAGDGGEMCGPAGVRATATSIGSVAAIAVGPDGSLYLTQQNLGGYQYCNRVSQVTPDGMIKTFAGGLEIPGFSGDGGPATSARLIAPVALAVGSSGEVYIGDEGNHRIRLVGVDGNISTFAGNGVVGTSGDDGPATAAQMAYVRGLTVTPQGELCTSDPNYSRVRVVKPALPGVSLTDIPIASHDGRELYVFDSEGRHLRNLDMLTNAVTRELGYDARGLLVSVTDANGNTTTIEREADGTPVAIVAPFGQRTELQVNSDNYLSSIANPLGESTLLTYFPSSIPGHASDGMLATFTTPRGQEHRFFYEALTGRLLRDEDPAGGFKTLARQDAQSATVSWFQVDVASALGRTTNYKVEYPATKDRVRTNTMPDGTHSVQTIKPSGLTSSTMPDGTLVTVQQGPDPRFGMQAPIATSTVVKLPSNLTSTTTLSRTAVLSDPLNPASMVTMTETTTVNGRTTTRAYDASTRTWTTTSPMGRVSYELLDPLGRTVRQETPGIVPIETAYDAHGRVAQITLGARISSWGYDPTSGFTTSATDALTRTTTFDNDALGRVLTETFADTTALGYGYDAEGNTTLVTPPGKPGHGFNYTPVGLLDVYTPPTVNGSGATLTDWDYDLDRQVTQMLRPDGLLAQFGYDKAGRASALTLPTGALTYDYSPTTGQLTSVSGPGNETVTWVFDGSLQTNEAWSGDVAGSVHWVYDNSFRLVQETVNGAQSVSYAYDNDDLVTGAGALTQAFDPLNGLLTGSAIGSVSDTLGYNEYGETSSYAASYAGTSLYAVTYDRDLLGRIASKTETVGGVTSTYEYSYDLVGRLLSVAKDGVLESEYSYDANGNRLDYSGPRGAASGTYDDQDRMLTFGTATYEYTANGELWRKTDSGEVTTYTRDILGNLLRVDLPDGTYIEYIVDGVGRRVGKKANGVMVQGFLYRDGLRPVAELDGAGNVVARFVYADSPELEGPLENMLARAGLAEAISLTARGGPPAYLVKGGDTYRLITDQVGSVRLVVNVATGAVVQRIDYDEFGNVVVDTNAGFQPFGFAGGLYDGETGLVRFGARDYDAEVGRWTSKDPAATDGRTSNPYGYAGEDPINRMDPNGLMTPWGECTIACQNDCDDRKPSCLKKEKDKCIRERNAPDSCGGGTKTAKNKQKSCGDVAKEACKRTGEACYAECDKKCFGLEGGPHP